MSQTHVSIVGSVGVAVASALAYARLATRISLFDLVVRKAEGRTAETSCAIVSARHASMMALVIASRRTLLALFIGLAPACEANPPAPPTDGGTGDGGATDGGAADGGVDADVVTDAGTDGRLADPRIPHMRPITRAKARELAAYARRLRVRSLGSLTDEPMAWSLINLQCSDRALAINWALAAADPARLDQAPPPLRASDITNDTVAALHTAPAFDSARIHVNAPLVTTQRLLDPRGTEVESEPNYWPNHVGTIVNVEGTIEVIDLSVGDEPMRVEAWLASFVSPGVPCALRDEVDALSQWVYWMQAGGGAPGFNPAVAPPSPECVYYYTPLFRDRWDVPPIGARDAQSLAESLANQTVVFRGILARLGGRYDDADIPNFLSVYEARTLGWMCDQIGRESGIPVCRRF